jgi:energy-coupling factor transport system ATP-binding protein
MMRDGPEGVVATAIRVQNLTYTYPPAHSRQVPSPALRDVSLDVPEGQFVAVLGRVGAGKSTLCMALNGLVPHATGGIFHGDVVIHDLNTKRQPVSAMAAHVGLLFQDPESQIVQTRVEDEVAFGPENLGVPPGEIAERVAWALAATGLADFRDRPPLLLSGGEKQRVAIAALLAMRPRLLVLDEPTASLDPTGKGGLFSVLYRLRREHRLTLVMATQDLDRAFRYADRIVVLDNGAIVLDGSPEEVLRQADRLDALGLGLPETVEVAHRLTAVMGRRYTFIAPSAAYACLHRELRSRRKPASGVVAAHTPAADGPSQITIEHLSFAYEPGHPALEDVSLALHAGEFVALLGRNGSGKTTLARHLNGLLKPGSGVVRVAGQDTRNSRVAALARRVGYVFQNPDHQIFAPTVRAEIAFGPRVQGAPAAEVDRRVADELDRFGLADSGDLPPAALGYSQRRIVALAAVLATEPDILILDEPTDGLDARSQAELMAAVTRFNAGGGTVVLITHDVRLAVAHAHRFVVLAAGRLIFDGAPGVLFGQAELLAQAGLRPPLVWRLAKRLGPALGFEDILTPGQFASAWQTSLGQRAGAL